MICKVCYDINMYKKIGFILSSLAILGLGCQSQSTSIVNNTKQLNMNQSDAVSMTPAEVQVIPNSSNRIWTVLLNGESVGDIMANDNEGEITVSNFKQTDTAVYLGVELKGLGGYILYGGPRRLYKLDIITKELTNIIGDSQDNHVSGFISDISPDEQWTAYVNDSDQQLTIDLLSLSGDGAIHQIMVPEQYQQIGDVKFSPNGNQLAYAAAVGNPEHEAGAVFVVTLGTDSQKEIDHISNTYFTINGWKTATTVDYAPGGEQ